MKNPRFYFWPVTAKTLRTGPAGFRYGAIFFSLGSCKNAPFPERHGEMFNFLILKLKKRKEKVNFKILNPSV
jgi:hypothetical protein